MHRSGNACVPLDALIDGFKRSADAAVALDRRLVALRELARKLFDAMKFDFLFDPERELLSIGYRVGDGSLDPSYYDLLASEARLASFVAIAKGDVPTRHWFRLGRALAPVRSGSALISWTGSMFEYLMPVSGDARAGRKPARGDQPPNRARANDLWRQARRAVGRFGIGLQCARSGTHLSIFQLRRAAPRAQARARATTMSSLRTRPRLAAMVDPRAAARNFAVWPKSAAAADTAGMKPWITPRPAYPKAPTSPSFALTWRITRA